MRALTPAIGAYLELEDGERLGVDEARVGAGRPGRVSSSRTTAASRSDARRDRARAPQREAARQARDERGATICAAIGRRRRVLAAVRRVSATASRRCAYTVVRRVFEQGAYADRAFRAEAGERGLEPRDRAFAMRLAYGTVQMKATLDRVLATLARRPLEKLDPPVLAALQARPLRAPLHGRHARPRRGLGERRAREGDDPARARIRERGAAARGTRRRRSSLEALDDSTPAGRGACLLASRLGRRALVRRARTRRGARADAPRQRARRERGSREPAAHDAAEVLELLAAEGVEAAPTRSCRRRSCSTGAVRRARLAALRARSR